MDRNTLTYVIDAANTATEGIDHPTIVSLSPLAAMSAIQKAEECVRAGALAKIGDEYMLPAEARRRCVSTMSIGIPGDNPFYETAKTKELET